jgi:hypothetical protein
MDPIVLPSTTEPPDGYKKQRLDVVLVETVEITAMLVEI